jgi:hypothetical protein
MWDRRSLVPLVGMGSASLFAAVVVTTIADFVGGR